MTWSTARTPTWARPPSPSCPEAGSRTRAWCLSARCPGPGWSPGRWQATPSPAPRRSRRPHSNWLPDSPNWFTATRRESSRAGSGPFEFPAELADADTIGIIYDETDGLNFYNEYGTLRDLFADPALAGDKRYSQVLRGYLGADSIGPLPFRRLAAAHQETVDAVFRKMLRKPDFTWAEHGEALLRRRKPWYYEREPRPGISVIGTRLSELAGRR
jgi:hypothetical protein